MGLGQLVQSIVYNLMPGTLRRRARLQLRCWALMSSQTYNRYQPSFKQSIPAYFLKQSPKFFMVQNVIRAPDLIPVRLRYVTYVIMGYAVRDDNCNQEPIASCRSQPQLYRTATTASLLHVRRQKFVADLLRPCTIRLISCIHHACLMR